ncbi:hypothetical protein ACFX2I_037915 [Malus domestica]
MLEPSNLLFETHHFSRQRFNLTGSSKYALGHVGHRTRTLHTKSQRLLNSQLIRWFGKQFVIIKSDKVPGHHRSSQVILHHRIPNGKRPVGDMKDGRHMLSKEGMAASSPRFKSKRRSEGPNIFKGVEERRGRTSQDLRSARREFLQAQIQVCFKMNCVPL